MWERWCLLSSIYLYHGNDSPYCPVYIFIVGTVVHSVLHSALSLLGIGGPDFPVYMCPCSGNSGQYCPLYRYHLPGGPYFPVCSFLCGGNDGSYSMYIFICQGNDCPYYLVYLYIWCRNSGPYYPVNGYPCHVNVGSYCPVYISDTYCPVLRFFCLWNGCP